MSLQIESVIVQYKVKAEEWSRFVTEQYGQDFNFSADQRLNADSRIACAFDTNLDDETEAEVRELSDFIEVGIYYDITQILLNEFARNGLIKPGRYYIQL